MERAKTQGRKRSVVRALVCAGMVLILVGIFRPRERMLLNVARPVVGMTYKSEKAFWLSAHQLLLLTTLQEAYGNTPNSARPPRAWQGVAALLDTTTHTQTPLTALTALLNQTGVQPESFVMNPYGPGLMWESTQDLGLVCTAFPDGTHVRQWRRLPANRGFYMDERHFLQTTNEEPRVVVYDLLEPAKDRTYRQLEDTRTVLTEHYSRHPLNIELSGDSSTAPSGWAKQAPRGWVEIEAYRIDTPLHFSSDDSDAVPEQSFQSQRVNLPAGATLAQGWASPQQTSLIYDLLFERPSSIPVWLHRFVSKSQKRSTFTEGLWVSRADGQGLREIGHIPVPAPLDWWGRPEGHLSNLHWLPDGKQVSFVYAGTLYTVPAEPER